jgi:hypothetical protein
VTSEMRAGWHWQQCLSIPGVGRIGGGGEDAFSLGL